MAEGITVHTSETRDYHQLGISHPHDSDNREVSRHKGCQIGDPNGSLGAVHDLDTGGLQPDNDVRPCRIGDGLKQRRGVSAKRERPNDCRIVTQRRLRDLALARERCDRGQETAGKASENTASTQAHTSSMLAGRSRPQCFRPQR